MSLVAQRVHEACMGARRARKGGRLGSGQRLARYPHSMPEHAARGLHPLVQFRPIPSSSLTFAAFWSSSSVVCVLLGLTVHLRQPILSMSILDSYAALGLQDGPCACTLSATCACSSI